MKLVLTLPPTTNQQYGMKGSFKFLTGDAKAWRAETQWRLRILKQPILFGPIAVTLRFFLKYERDVDNVKLLLDTLTGYLYKDDTQITELHIYKTKDKANPRVEVEI